MNDINDVLVVSDTPYFAEGVATLLHHYAVSRICLPLSRENMFNAEYPVGRMVVLSVENTTLATSIADCFTRTGVPVLVVSDRRADLDDALKNMDVYVADRNTRASGFRQMVDALLAKREVEQIHLSLTQRKAMRRLTKGYPR
ncbi:hypothetical protein [Salmonella enterica]|uniref:hypothetical protein n=1 Tax=Salmonella enterica TaxID=28901 RepID=UPI0016017E1A|nr:hypothetical protein [Salmonella enterica]